MAEVLFLDGPLRGQIRDVSVVHAWMDCCTISDSDMAQFALEFDGPLAAEPRREVVRYWFKKNYHRHGPVWAAAVGKHVGSPITCVVPMMFDASNAVLAEGYARDAALKQIIATCAADGLVPVEFREEWRGTAEDARRLLTDPDARELCGRVVSAAGAVVEDAVPGSVFFVFEAVAAVPDEAPC